jgi:glycosyltransferase involved in cell wall biosynthesis
MPGTRLVESEAGDDGAAVNAGVARARGRYVAVLDGSDAVAPSFLLRALQIAEAEGPEAIARPGVVVKREAAEEEPERRRDAPDEPRRLEAVEQADMRDGRFDISLLAGSDLWSPIALARRDLFLRFPRRETAPGSGWGHSAWHWTCETVENGCRHVAVPQTAVFRVADVSGERDLALGSRGWVALPPSRFFGEGNDAPHVNARSGVRTLDACYAPELDRHVVPDWLLAETSRMDASVPQLAGETLGGIRGPRLNSSAGEAYWSCRDVISRTCPTHMVLVPRLGPGGGELAASFCAEAILSRPENRLLVVCADSGDETRAGLPDGAELLPFGAIAASCPFDERVDVLTRLLVNSSARSVHVFYTSLGWEVLRRHAAALSEHLRIFVSIFSVPPFETGFNAGFPRRLATVRRHVAAVFTDNRRAADAVMRSCGLGSGQVVALRHPVLARSAFRGAGSGEDLVLWAGRLDPHKRPELLGEIAVRLPHRRFDVWGSPVLSDGHEFAALASLPNIRLRGPFRGFGSIPDAPYQCFLYTSVWGGLPNVLLEAVASGLLGIGSDVGAVREVLGGGRGVLVRPAGDPGAYVEALERSFRDQAWARERAERGRRQVVEAHTREGFFATLASVPDYL